MAVDPSTTSLDQLSQLDNLAQLDIGDHIKTPQIKTLYNENQKLKQLVKELFDYQNANPKLVDAKSRSEIDREKVVEKEIEAKSRKIRAQLGVVRTLFRQGAVKVREEKEATAEARKTNDQLLLQLNNLEYEEQSLQSEINAAKGYDHKWNKLPLITTEEFLEHFPEHKDSSEQELMKARIDHEHQVRVKLEEQRQEKLKKKQLLFANVKKGKDDLTKLDGMLEKFIEEAEPIKKVLEAE
ncbi:Fms-interacting protein-domain-containing protein [Lophiotrema nucula]|uniref:Fms-interacting protein-domain-containing protein n=1 Tax=Lophiotrema nucula TaxID=690887 RepID=A0A6A5YZ28_9PLEO|nr:Fms-interacting protein-domain-containing protein [Lophiotrema nucula]